MVHLWCFARTVYDFYGPKRSKFWPSQNFPGPYTYSFWKNTPKVVLRTKYKKCIVAFGKYRLKRLKIVDFGPNFTISGHFGGQKIFLTEIFFRHFVSLIKVQLCAKKQEKTQKVGAVGPCMVILDQKRANLDQKGPNFGPLRIFPNHTPTFSERVHQNSFLEQISRKFIAVFRSYRSKTLKNVNFCQKWPNFGHKWPNFGHFRIFLA